MNEKLLHNLHELTESIRENSARVESRLSAIGAKADPAIVTSLAKYYKAIELLSKE